MTNKQMESVMDEAGVIKASDYQDLKNRIAFERVKGKKDLESLILSCAARILATRRKPENMSRPQKKGKREPKGVTE